MSQNKNSVVQIGAVAKKAGVTKKTLYNWFSSGKIPEVNRDRNNYRIFDEDDLETILAYANKTTIAPHKL